MASEAVNAAHLEESLRQRRLKLAVIRERFEQPAENQAAADQACDQLAVLTGHVDTVFTRTEYNPRRARLDKAPDLHHRRHRAGGGGRQGPAQSRLFDGAWYLSTYPSHGIGTKLRRSARVHVSL